MDDTRKKRLDDLLVEFDTIDVLPSRGALMEMVLLLRQLVDEMADGPSPLRDMRVKP